MTVDYSKKANLVLGWVFALFAAAAVIHYFYPDHLVVKLLYTVFEAALVGGIADWFAVTALFRRPLGIPWHTALIPSNRDKMIGAIAAAVQNDLLSKDSIKRRLAGARIVDLAIKWVEERDRQTIFSGLVAHYAERVLADIDSQALAKYGQRLLKNYLRKAMLADKIRQVLDWALRSGALDRLLDYILAELRVVVERDSSRQAIQQYLEKYKESVSQSWWQQLILDIAELTNTLNMAEAASVLHGEVQHFIRDMADREHPFRHWIRVRLAVAGDNLANDSAWRENILAWQHGLAGRLEFADALAVLIVLARDSVTPADAAAWAGRQTEKLWNTFKADTELQDWVEERLKLALGEFIDIEHRIVATIVKEALQRLSDSDLNRFVEDKAGEDLAWIRINGSVVGGIVGLLLFLILHYFYDPYVVPLIRAWL
ncbi:MAG: DUF445 domain-containing protein [Negativicutes bacterium]|nr:DUF445 domain-containing protein [Negativicutes bacterium]